MAYALSLSGLLTTFRHHFVQRPHAQCKFNCFNPTARACYVTFLLLLLLRFYCAGQRSTPHYRTLEVRPGRIKLELKYDYERDDTNSLLGVLMFGWDVVMANNE